MHAELDRSRSTPWATGGEGSPALLAQATDYAQWAAAAQALDRRDGAQRWRDDSASELYDHSSIADRLDELRQLLAQGDDDGLLFLLNGGIHGNLDGIGHERLWQKARFGTKGLIHEYVDTLTEALRRLARPARDASPLDVEEQRDFFERASISHGRSGLLFSGAGAFLHFHVGVARALISEGLLPAVVAGSSGGAIVAAQLCTHTDDRLAALLSTEAQQAFARVSVREGLQKQLADMIASAVPDMTFRQAYECTGRHLCISVETAEKHQNGRLLSAITSPDVCIREAVLASCAVPLVLPPVTLMALDRQGRRVPYDPQRQWVDGSVTHDLPIKRLSRLYGVNHSIVSQANPLVTPFATHLRTPRNSLESVQRTAASSLRDWASLGLELMERPMALFPPPLNRLPNLSQALINQDHSGDIDIVCPALLWPPHKVLAQPSADDIAMLIDLGERCAWPRLEQIRLQTQVSRELEQILKRLEESDPSASASRRKPAAGLALRPRRSHPRAYPN